MVARHGFARERRLLDAAAFGQVFRDGRKSIDDHLVVLARRNRLAHARLGLAIARKQVRRAVDRNRIKRVIRASFRLHQDQLQGLDIVVVSRTQLPSLSNRLLGTALARHWQRVIEQCKNS